MSELEAKKGGKCATFRLGMLPSSPPMSSSLIYCLSIDIRAGCHENWGYNTCQLASFLPHFLLVLAGAPERHVRLQHGFALNDAG